MWYASHRYPPSSVDQVIAWWIEKTGDTYVSREFLTHVQKLVERCNRDIPRPLRCHACEEVDGVVQRCRRIPAGVHVCMGEHFCKQHLRDYA